MSPRRRRMAGRNIEIILSGLAAVVRTQDPRHIREFLAEELVLTTKDR